MNAKPAAASPSTSVPLTNVLERVFIELRDLAETAEKLQDLPGKVALSANGIVVDFIEDAQSLDLLSQRLEAIATFLNALRNAVPQSLTVDPIPAASLLTLSDLARRLLDVNSSPDGREEPEPGDFELF